MGLYLEFMHFLLLAFLDRRLSPIDRLKKVGMLKAVFTLWREASEREKGIVRQHTLLQSNLMMT